MELIVATWNVERVGARSWKKLPAQRAAMARVDADIWVLTETREWLAPVAGYHPLHCPPLVGHDPDERLVSIWSRWPITPTDLAPRPRGAVSGIVDSPAGPLAVFGSVIPYAHAKGPDGTSRLWEEHYREIDRLAIEWPQLSAELPLVVAGDLNQDRDGSRWYGTHKGRAMLSQAFDAAGLTCHTAVDMVAAGLLARHHLIDHIATSADLSPIGDPHCSEPIDDEGVRMSDHPGVAISLRATALGRSDVVPPFAHQK